MGHGGGAISQRLTGGHIQLGLISGGQSSPEAGQGVDRFGDQVCQCHAGADASLKNAINQVFKMPAEFSNLSSPGHAPRALQRMKRASDIAQNILIVQLRLPNRHRLTQGFVFLVELVEEDLKNVETIIGRCSKLIRILGFRGFAGRSVPELCRVGRVQRFCRPCLVDFRGVLIRLRDFIDRQVSCVLPFDRWRLITFRAPLSGRHQLISALGPALRFCFGAFGPSFRMRA